mmetsp:Transcript_75151/g.220048  ORF Transcript_75151/g.220048 Transcript_75151/m.220048 type:complete len:205 (-) Transcript_75151:2-616(-)
MQPPSKGLPPHRTTSFSTSPFRDMALTSWTISSPPVTLLTAMIRSPDRTLFSGPCEVFHSETRLGLLTSSMTRKLGSSSGLMRTPSVVQCWPSRTRVTSKSGRGRPFSGVLSANVGFTCGCSTETPGAFSPGDFAPYGSMSSAEPASSPFWQQPCRQPESSAPISTELLGPPTTARQRRLGRAGPGRRPIGQRLLRAPGALGSP